jgi:class 3 adenylate cyclase/predicted ATPase
VAIVTCAACNAENAAGRKFCDQCGSSLAFGCPACGAQNRPEARFCGECGAQLMADAASPAVATAAPRATPPPAVPPTPATTEAERRLVSVLFADLVAFTEYSEGRDPELVRETLSRYFEATRTVIERHGGRVEKFIGDAVMAAWGAPKANEDDAERAVRAALEVIHAVTGLDEGLRARVAVLTGQAAVTLNATDQGMVAGDLVNTAARLQGVAPPNSVLVGEPTMQAAGSAIVFEPVGPQTLKGKDAPVPAWRALRVISDRGGSRATEALEPPFVGREVELRLLKDKLHQTTDEQRPRLISITGPAGIGKSRLAWEFEKYVDGLVEGVFWHRGRAPSYGEGVTFWALGEMVRERAGLAESADEDTTRERIAAMVQQFVPTASDQAWIEPALLTLLGLEPAPAGGREVLFAAWRTFFERVAAGGTTVLLFEDLQWADGGQLDFIEHVMEWAKGVPLLVVTLARPDLLERRPGWGTGARSFNTVGLEPLTDANMRALLLGLVPEMPSSTVEAIVARADGIALYAVETVRMLLADGRLTARDDDTFEVSGDLGQLAVPDTLRALIASRLDGLDDADRGLLQDAAVLGKTFGVDALAAISGSASEALEGRLPLLVKRELLEVSVDPRSPERGQYGFVQSVIREVAYDTLSRRDRRARHLAAARYFEGLGDDELAGVLSTHYLAAYQASDDGPEAEALQIQARLSLRGAADRAIQLGAADQALACLDQALEITSDVADRAPMLEQAADAADLEGRYERAEALCLQAIEAYGAAGDRTGEARVSALMGGILADASKLTETVEFLGAAIAKADRPEDEAYRADMLARLSRAHMRLSQNEAAIRRADEALAIAEPLRLDRVIAEAFINKSASLGADRRLREPVVLMEAAIRLAADIGDAALELRARNNLAAVLGAEDGDRAWEVAREAYELAVRLGIRQMASWTIGALAWGSMYYGRDWDQAIAGLDAEIEMSASDADRGRLIGIREALMAWRGMDRSALISERERLTASMSDPEMAIWTTLYGAIDDLLAGRHDAAIAGFRACTQNAYQSTLDARLGLALAAQLAGDPDAARESVRQADEEEYGGRAIEAGRSLARAGVAALDGRAADAVELYREAIERYEQASYRFGAALTRLMALTLLPAEPAVEGWEPAARDFFESIHSPPLLALLDSAVGARRQPATRA